MTQADLQTSQLLLQQTGIAIPPSMGQGTGMQLHTGGSGFGGRIDLSEIRTDEQGHPRTSLCQADTGGMNTIELADHVQPAFGGDFLTALGNQAHVLRLGLLDDV